MVRFFLLMLWVLPLYAADVQGVRVWVSPDNTRVVLDLSKPVKYKLFTLENPQRVVIDIEEAHFKAKLTPLKNSAIVKIRYSMLNPHKLRIVFDLHKKVRPTSFLLSPQQNYGHRLVVDLAQEGIPLKPVMSEKLSARDFVIAIDPGHGGEDSGAIGRSHRLREKDVVLKVSQKLQALINRQKGMRAILIRRGDYYVELRKRMELARNQGADLFISVHADSFNDPRASGASVYVLSEKGASSEAARWLAEKENRSDLVGGIRLDDKNDLLASVLLDLSQTASRSASQELGNHLINNLAKVTDLHHNTVQRAGFMVLKSPDIPSVLVELGFISNKKGEEKLRDARHQQALATALLSGVKAYLAKRALPIAAPPNWTIAQK